MKVINTRELKVQDTDISMQWVQCAIAGNIITQCVIYRGIFVAHHEHVVKHVSDPNNFHFAMKVTLERCFKNCGMARFHKPAIMKQVQNEISNYSTIQPKTPALPLNTSS